MHSKLLIWILMLFLTLSVASALTTIFNPFTGTLDFIEDNTTINLVNTTVPSCGDDEFTTANGTDFICQPKNTTDESLYGRIINISQLNGTRIFISGLENCDTINTTSEGELICGTDETTAGGADSSAADDWNYGNFSEALGDNETLVRTNQLNATSEEELDNQIGVAIVVGTELDNRTDDDIADIVRNGTAQIANGTLNDGEICVYSGATIDCDINTIAELETALDSTNVLINTELDSESELETLLSDVSDVFTNNDGTLGNSSEEMGLAANSSLQADINTRLRNSSDVTIRIGTITSNFSVDTTTFYVDSDSNMVGVGTTTPSEELEVQGDVRVDQAGSPTVTIGDFTAIASDAQLYLRSTGSSEIQTSAGGAFVFLDTVGTEFMVINTTSGNIGIGTTESDEELSILTTSSGDQTLLQLVVPNAPGNNAGIDFSVGSGTGIPVGRIEMEYGASNEVGMSFHTFDSSLAEMMRLTYDGNLGIGTQDPTVSLVVVGDTNITGTLNVTDVNVVNNVTLEENSTVYYNLEKTIGSKANETCAITFGPTSELAIC